MAHVASALKSQLLKGMLPQPGKQTYASDAKAQNSFDSLLDSNTPPAPEPRQTRAAEDKAPRTERSERSERPKSADRPDRPADAAEPAPKAEASETTDTKPAETAVTEKPAAEDETKTTEATEQPAEAEAADATAVVAVATVVDPTITPAKTEASTDVKAEAAAVVAAAATTAAQTTPDTAAEVTADTEAAPGALATLAAEAEKTTDDKPAATAKAETKAETKAPGALTENATPQVATAEPHKDSEAHASAQETANTHRGVAADKPAAPAAPATDISATTAAPKADLIPPPTLNVAVPAHAAQATTAAAAANITAEASKPDAAVPVAGVAFEITSKVMSGKNQFDIRLDPAELGRIHVRLDVDRDGNVVTHMMADRPDTLDMLRKDTAGLERALQDAGLKTSDNSLQFSLRDQSTNQQQSNENGRSNTAHLVVEDEKPVADTIQRNYAAYRSQAGGLDIRV